MKKEEGITLIALIITIIVLLILAGISINSLINDNGIFRFAESITEKYNDSVAEEMMEMYKVSNAIGEEVSIKDKMINDGVITQEDIDKEGIIHLSNNVLIITTYEDLKTLSKSVDDGEDYKGKKLYVINNIDCGAEFNIETGELIKGENFIPIGTSNSRIEDELNEGSIQKVFNGKIDGMGYNIENIYIKKSDAGTFCTALIGYLGENGKITDLNIKNSYIEGYYEIGALVGRNRGKIINCTNESIVIGHDSLTGGIAGRNTNTIENCTNKGNIIGGRQQTGGIVGNCDFGNNVIVKNCNNYGNIDVEYEECLGGIGGIAGGTYTTNENNHVEISNCYNKGRIGNIEVSYSAVGGIVGSAKDIKDKIFYYNIEITNCTNLGQVNGYMSVGGICRRDRKC